MVVIEVSGMSCQHCVAAVQRAVHTVHAGAAVKVDLASGRVEIDADAAEAAPMRAAIEAEGYAARAG